jgi:hypothetical protein
MPATNLSFLVDTALTGTTTATTLNVGTALAVPAVALGTSSTAAASTAFATGTAGLTVRVLADAAAAILETTGVLWLVSSTTGSKTITQTSTRPHQHLRIYMEFASGGDYKLLEASGVPGGVLTFNATGEYADLYRNAADDAWDIVLTGATIV